MRKWQLLFLITGICGWMLPGRLMAQEGTISADPNPCRIEPGQTECTSFIRWDTRGADRVKVFVTAEGRRREVEKEFGTSLSCETRRCRAPWISPGTTYTFQLVDFSRGDRGRVLASVTVTAEGEGGREERREAGGEAWGTISADPNPCRIRGDERECGTSIIWQTRGVERAKVFVTAEGRNREVEKEFSASPNCEPGRCRAGWIAPETRYLFQLVDFSRGDRGRVLASVTVRAEER
jgi:hypothetical protein